MKKAYTKPELFCEEYQLSVSIAAHCASWIDPEMVNSSDYTSCGYYLAGRTLFMERPNCDDRLKYDGDRNVCYQQPSEENKVFSS